MRPILPLLVAFSSACSPSNPNSPGHADEPITVSIDEQATLKTRDLWQRLANDELNGLALVADDAVLFPSAAAARSAAPRRQAEPHGFRTVHILDDGGDVVKVRTWLSPRVREGTTPLTDYDLTLYATRAQLIPVLRSVVNEVFADGSGYVLQEGMALTIGNAVEPLDAQLRAAPFTIHPNHVGLAFPLQGKDAALDIDPAPEELACERVPHRSSEELATNRIRFVPQKEVLARQRAEDAERLRDAEKGQPIGLGGFQGVGRFGYQDRRSCSLGGDSEFGPKGTSLLLNGTPFMRPRDVPGDSCVKTVSVYRAASEQQALVDVFFNHAQLRVLVDRQALRAGGGCGGMIGTLGRGAGIRGPKPPPPPKIQAVSGKKKVFFPDGSFAGYHMHGTTKLRDAQVVAGRSCIEHANVSTRVCFEANDLIEVDDRRDR